MRKRAGSPLGQWVTRLSESYGVTHFVPFSSMHRYQREDSGWANECTTPIEAHATGFRSKRCAILPAFVRFDVACDRVEPLNPPLGPAPMYSAKHFDDDWSEDLEKDELALAARYFRSIEHLSTCIDYVNLRVGGRDHVIDIGARKFGRGVTFEAPRHSLVTALQFEIFDDLLIGNFMKTTLHGKWPATGLYPDFSPYVAKYADNGHARSAQEVKAYFAEYRRRTGGFAYLRHRLAARTESALRAAIPRDSFAWRCARRTYSMLRFQG
jgi:hypothetical protein